MTTIWIDGDACPVREEVFRVALRRGLRAVLVGNGARGVRVPKHPLLSLVVVAAGADSADDHIATHITPADVCVTADIPLAARCLDAGARALAPRGQVWSAQNIGSALAGREVARHLRETGHETRHAGFTAADRSRFLVALDALLDRRAERPRLVLPPGGF